MKMRLEAEYRVLIHAHEFRALYDRFRADGSLWAFWPDVAQDEWTQESFCRFLARDGMYVLGGYIASQLAGVMLLWPVALRTQCAEIALSAFRPFYSLATPLCQGALLKVLDELDIASIIGRVAAPNRHCLNLMKGLGFRELGRVPGLYWYARLGKFVSGALVMATPESIKKTINASEA